MLQSNLAEFCGWRILIKLGKEYLNALLSKFVIYSLQHSETSDVSTTNHRRVINAQTGPVFLAHPVSLSYLKRWLFYWLQQQVVVCRPVESHSGARGNILAGPPNIFTGPLWGENFLIFLIKMVHSDVLYISGRQRPPQNVAGPAVA